jgi:hypothetical protein
VLKRVVAFGDGCSRTGFRPTIRWSLALRSYRARRRPAAAPSVTLQIPGDPEVLHRYERPVARAVHMLDPATLPTPPAPSASSTSG